MAWERHRYRRNKAWILVDDEGRPILDDRGLASLRYKPEDERTYSVRPDALRPLGSEEEAADAPHPIDVYADACVGEASSGAGVVLVWRDQVREIARPLEPGPLPRAGAEAVLTALEALRRRDLPVRVHTSHIETVNALRKPPRGTSATPLGLALKQAVRRFKDLRFQDLTSDGNRHAARALALAREAAGMRGGDG